MGISGNPRQKLRILLWKKNYEVFGGFWVDEYWDLIYILKGPFQLLLAKHRICLLGWKPFSSHNNRQTMLWYRLWKWFQEADVGYILKKKPTEYMQHWCEKKMEYKMAVQVLAKRTGQKAVLPFSEMSKAVEEHVWKAMKTKTDTLFSNIHHTVTKICHVWGYPWTFQNFQSITQMSLTACNWIWN